MGIAPIETVELDPESEKFKSDERKWNLYDSPEAEAVAAEATAAWEAGTPRVLGDSGLSQEVVTENAEEEGEEGRVATGAAVPYNPSGREREEHELTHTPYRSWCDYCERARGRNKPHQPNREDTDEKNKIPRISFDYFFFSQEEQAANQNPMIDMLDERIGEKYARKVEQQGLGEDGEAE